MESANEENTQGCSYSSIYCRFDVCRWIFIVTDSLSFRSLFRGEGYLHSRLTSQSAPIFSMLGLVVRFRVSSNPDTTYNTSVILLWAYVTQSSFRLWY